MKINFERNKTEKETVEEMIKELVYLRKVINNAVYYETSISLRATHLIDTILFFHDSNIKDKFTSNELKEIISQFNEGKSEQELLCLNIEHINDSIENLDSLLNKILRENYESNVESSYDDLQDILYNM